MIKKLVMHIKQALEEEPREEMDDFAIREEIARLEQNRKQIEKRLQSKKGYMRAFR